MMENYSELYSIKKRNIKEKRWGIEVLNLQLFFEELSWALHKVDLFLLHE